MKYKIIIEKIETKIVQDSAWRDDSKEDKETGELKGGYVEIEVEKEVATKIYEQTREEKIDLKSIINAFNSPDLPE